MRRLAVLDVTRILIEALVADLKDQYRRTYGSQDPDVPEVAAWAAELALENIARSDALYHDVEHTVMVTQCGAELLRCRHLVRGGVSPRDWLHVVLSLLCHDIGYVRGVCRGDRPGAWLTGVGEATTDLPPGATDAALTPFHVDRGIRFVRERFPAHRFIDVDVLARNIAYTRFPVPADPEFAETGSLRALVRAADLIGQLADPKYLQKLPALFREMEETGQHRRHGFANPNDMRVGFPEFYEKSVAPWIGEALDDLSVTAQGRLWIASLHDHVHRTRGGDVAQHT
ncbi:MAG: metal-dependent phosphohydrolase [Alphaproteobacteria bacterium]|nr:metal-dependent phosphohydrolase [Alphaproteobacteria bacterium]